MKSLYICFNIGKIPSVLAWNVMVFFSKGSNEEGLKLTIESRQQDVLVHCSADVSVRAYLNSCVSVMLQ